MMFSSLNIIHGRLASGPFHKTIKVFKFGGCDLCVPVAIRSTYVVPRPPLRNGFTT